MFPAHKRNLLFFSSLSFTCCTVALFLALGGEREVGKYPMNLGPFLASFSQAQLSVTNLRASQLPTVPAVKCLSFLSCLSAFLCLPLPPVVSLSSPPPQVVGSALFGLLDHSSLSPVRCCSCSSFAPSLYLPTPLSACSFPGYHPSTPVAKSCAKGKKGKKKREEKNVEKGNK